MIEKHNIEWKAMWKDEYLAWICGFANAQGGKLLVGVDDSGMPIGLANSKKLMEDLPNKIRDALGIVVDVNLQHQAGTEYIEIDVPSYSIAISCKGSYYYRSGSTNQRLTGAELESFILQRRGVRWESAPMPQLSLTQIDGEVIRFFHEKAATKGRLAEESADESKEHFIEKLYLKNGDYFTNAAALLFSANPDQWFLGAYIKVGFFENDADLLYQDEIHGSLLQQVDRAMELIYLKYLKAKISYDGIQRLERYFIPQAALREALLNAVVHKDYSSGIPIQVSVYSDRLYIANVGRLPETWTLDNLMSKHASQPFNPNIAHVFYLAGFIESWGRGIEKIFHACADDNVPPPEYSIHPNDIMIQFTAPEERIIRSNSFKVTNGVTNRVTNEVTDREQAVLAILMDDPGYTTQEIMDRMGVSRKSVSQYLKSLKEKGIIERIGSRRQGYWKINME